jgi:hypothetical protein
MKGALITSRLTPEQLRAAEWLEANWVSVVDGGPLTKVLRERFALPFNPAVQVIAEVKRKRESA